MSGASLLVYNGISLPYVKTEKFSQEIIYSLDGVDALYTKVTIGVGCVLSPCFFNGVDVPDWVRNVKPYLMARGSQLYFMMDGDYIMEPTVTAGPTYTFDCNYVPNGNEGIKSPAFTNAGGSVTTHIADAKLGPFPQRFDVRRIEGNTWLAYYEIITYIPYCPATADSAPYYLSNRWSTTVSFDDEYFITRSIDGILVINGQYGNQSTMTMGQPIDVIINDMVTNNIIIPPCPHRWKRDSIDIIRSSDGLTINYKITDKQNYVSMPRPATKIDAQYTETSGTKDFALMNMMVCEIQVTVHGEPNDYYNPTGTINGSGMVTWNPNSLGAVTGLDYNKYQLLTLMFQVVLSRIPYPFLISDSATTIGQNNKYIIQYFQMKEDVFKPIVGCTVRALRPRLYNTTTIGQTVQADNDSGQGIYNFTNIGSTLLIADVINDVARTPNNSGNYGIFLLAAQSLKTTVGTPTTSFTPCQLASALLYPCVDETYRNINNSLAPELVAQLGSANINVALMNYSVIGSTGDGDNFGAIQNTGKYYSIEQYTNPFTEYSLDIQYLTDQHKMQLPVMYDIYPIKYPESATPASGCVFCATSAPTTRKIVHWKASRIGQWPMNPIPNDIENGYGQYSAGTGSTIGPTGDELLSYHLTFQDSFLMQDGINRKYETAGVYECGLQIRLQWDQPGGIPTAVNPITTDVWESTIATTSIASASYYPNTNFTTGIIGYESPSGFGPGGGPISD